MAAKPAPPAGLSRGGAKLWRDIVKVHTTLDAAQLVQLHEACRAKDRCDQLDRVLRGDIDLWAEIVGDEDHVTCRLQIAPALSKANDTANLMKQLLASLRLPDASGATPQARGGSRGAYQSGGAGGTLGKLQSITGGKS